MTRPIDEDYVASVVLELRKLKFPSSEGYYLVVLSPLEACELKFRMNARRRPMVGRYRHAPEGLKQTAKNLGYKVTCVLDDALVVAADHSVPKVPRRGEMRVRLEIVRWS